MANRMVACSITSRDLLRVGGVAHAWRRLRSLRFLVAAYAWKFFVCFLSEYPFSFLIKLGLFCSTSCSHFQLSITKTTMSLFSLQLIEFVNKSKQTKVRWQTATVLMTIILLM